MTTLYPDVTVEFSPTTDPLDDPIWVDISEHLRSFSIDRGRSTELDRAEAGTATILLDNHLGYFDPNKSDGPWYPNIRPMRRVRIQAVTPATWAPFYVGASYVGGSDVLGGSAVGIALFSGFIETWAQNWTPQPFPVPDATATINAVDAFGPLAAMTNYPGLTGQSHVMIGLMLDAVGWPAGERNIESGAYYGVQTTAGGNTSPVLAPLQEIAASEGGIFFAARDGLLTFYGHAHVSPLQGTWGDSTDERQYQSVTLDYSYSSIWNSVIVSGPVAPDVIAEDEVSQEVYFLRTYSLSTLLVDADESQARAWDYLSRFSVPQQRITSMEVGVRDDVEWKDILSRDLLDRIIVNRAPIRGEVGISQDSIIQGISIKSESRQRWSVNWTLSAVPTTNRLTANQSNLNDGTTAGWVAVANCTLSRVTQVPAPDLPLFGNGALAMTATASADMSASTTPNTQMAVVPGRSYSAMAYFKATVISGKPCHVEIVWRDSGGAILSTSAGNTFTSANVFHQSGVTATAPVSAAFATVLLVVTGATAGQSQYVDAVGFFDGEHTGWSPGQG